MPMKDEDKQTDNESCIELLILTTLLSQKCNKILIQWKPMPNGI